jgi:hypothetical protein
VNTGLVFLHVMKIMKLLLNIISRLRKPPHKLLKCRNKLPLPPAPHKCRNKLHQLPALHKCHSKLPHNNKSHLAPMIAVVMVTASTANASATDASLENLATLKTSAAMLSALLNNSATQGTVSVKTTTWLLVLAKMLTAATTVTAKTANVFAILVGAVSGARSVTLAAALNAVTTVNVFKVFVTVQTAGAAAGANTKTLAVVLNAANMVNAFKA